MLWIILMITLAILIYFAHKNTYHMQVNNISLTVQPKDGMMDKDLHILHLSDLHMENISISPEHLYEQVKNKPIDLIALTGDYLDRAKNIDKFLTYVDVLKKLNPSYGIYVVFGNHDYILRKHHFSRLKDSLIEKGCHVLQNESRSIQINGQSIEIIGIDNFSNGKSDLNKSFEGVGDGIRIVLTHDPNVVLHMDDYHFDYLLSGHFHGGQIYWPKPYHLIKMGKLARRNIIKGLHFHKKRAFYISEGLGQTGFNIRVKSRPEITFHKLTAKKSA
ncbi:metallophosphoesterase [Microaerobacter geothermalis]|uniref:metallophosphoesterase n=1 Tax=Microaerobacter geothermalis TaxID=674972 RepID=UPI001F3C823B|nr:metallophosphoesterase [Microaerobacter geothermalis]MCF6095174.1 metallophosphoesterase [Microaerobacter geothermalis]